jgi:hypothetical protein
MDKIRTRIDDVFDFIQEKGVTTKKEVSKELCLNSDELEKFVSVLQQHHLIDVRYSLMNTYLSVGEEALANSY